MTATSVIWLKLKRGKRKYSPLSLPKSKTCVKLTTLIERIIAAPDANEEICHIFIKGCSKEDYDDFFRESEDEMCDLDRHSKCYSLIILAHIFISL